MKQIKEQTNGKMERQTRLSNDLFKALGEFKAVSTFSSGLTKVPRYMIDRCQKCLSDQAPATDNKRYSSYGISNLLHYSYLDLIKGITYDDCNSDSEKSSVPKGSFSKTKISNVVFFKALKQRFTSIQFHKGQILAARKIKEDQECQMVFVTLYKCALDKLIYQMVLSLFGIVDAKIITLEEFEKSNYLNKFDDLTYIVPIASSYDKIPDIPPISTHFPTAFTALKIFMSDTNNYGSMRINILQPVPLGIFYEFISGRISSNFAYDVSPSQSVVDHLRYDLLHGTAIMPTQLVSFLLLTRYRRGASVEQLKQSCEWLIDELYTRNISMGFSGDCKYVIQYACKLLTKDLIHIKSRADNSSPSIDKVEKYLLPSTSYPHVLELKQHASHLSPVFLLDSVLAISLVSLLSKQSQHTLFSDILETRIRVQRKLLIDEALRLCKLLTPHYVFTQPCYSISEMIEQRIELMVSRGYFIADDPPPFARNQDRYGLYDSDDDDDYFRADDPRFFQYIIVKQKRYAYRAIQMFYNILSPIIDSYLIVGQSLRRMLDNHMTMFDFKKNASELALSMIKSGHFKFEESVNDDYFEHALYMYQDHNVISFNEESLLIKLTNQYNSEKNIDHLMKNLNLAKYKLSI